MHSIERVEKSILKYTYKTICNSGLMSKVLHNAKVSLTEVNLTKCHVNRANKVATFKFVSFDSSIENYLLNFLNLHANYIRHVTQTAYSLPNYVKVFKFEVDQQFNSYYKISHLVKSEHDEHHTS